MELTMDALDMAMADDVAITTAEVQKKYADLRAAGFSVCATHSDHLCAHAKELVTGEKDKTPRVKCVKACSLLSKEEAANCRIISPPLILIRRPR